MNVVIYTKPNCPFCIQAKKLLEDNKINYEENVLDQHFTRQFLVETFPNAKNFPVILIDGFFIGGYNNLKSLIEQRQSNNTQVLLG
jgi:glutaredoxin 3